MSNRYYAYIMTNKHNTVLYTGKSGVGKSECALDLIERSHRLVADDAIAIGVDLGGAVSILASISNIRDLQLNFHHHLMGFSGLDLRGDGDLDAFGILPPLSHVEWDLFGFRVWEGVFLAFLGHGK